MWTLNYDSISELDSKLKENGLAMSRKFGQNFLISPEARRKIADLGDIQPDMKVWEIGPGLGAITSEMLKKGALLTAFEIDHGFARLLQTEAFADEAGFSLVEGDALKTLFSRPFDADRIMGNLPYNVGSVLIAKLIESSYLPEKMVFTLQKEVVERMCARPGEEEYSSFSVLCQLDYVPKEAMVLRKGCFWPSPNVDSAVIVMTRRAKSLVENEHRAVFLKMVRSLFAQRRKTVRNNLLSSEFSSLGKDRIETALASSGLTGTERAENLPYDTLIQLARSLE